MNFRFTMKTALGKRGLSLATLATTLLVFLATAATTGFVAAGCSVLFDGALLVEQRG
jgi:hypothetical protein